MRFRSLFITIILAMVFAFASGCTYVQQFKRNGLNDNASGGKEMGAHNAFELTDPKTGKPYQLWFDISSSVMEEKGIFYYRYELKGISNDYQFVLQQSPAGTPQLPQQVDFTKKKLIFFSSRRPPIAFWGKGYVYRKGDYHLSDPEPFNLYVPQ